MTEWLPYYKLESDGHRSLTQMAYEPLVSHDGTLFCMNFSVDNKYQNFIENIGFVPKLVYTFFDKELAYLDKFKNYCWCPEVVDVDFKNKKIFLKWYDNTCNDIINSRKNLNEYCPTWMSQLEDCTLDLLKNNTYKITMYPHCHYVTRDGVLKSFDFYGCFNFDNAKLPLEQIKGLIHSSSWDRIEEAVVDDCLDLKIMFYRSLETHIEWPNNFLNSMYQRIKNDRLA
jgi:hypothetical protein